jgi:tetratricopeptide (TPR) repeat protein
MMRGTAAVLLLFTLLLSCHSPEERPAPADYAAKSDTVRYVGMETCRNCHADIYDSFRRTGMGKSFDLADRQKSSALFPDHAPVYDPYRDLHYFPYWSGDSLHIREFRLRGRDTVFERDARVDYIVGSGQHTNSHLRQVNGYLFQAPMTYYTQKGTWDLPPGFEQGHNSRFGRKLEFECISCHNAYPDLVEGSEHKYDRIPNGIDCERCHGPGSEHVRQKLNGLLVDTANAIDYSIVNPAKLPIDLQLDVCQRCHIQGNAVLKPGKTFRDFRPSLHLSDVMDVYMPVYKGDEDAHIMASHAERMKMSACFIASAKAAEAKPTSLKPYRDAMTCVTCHNPHVSVRETGNAVFNQACNRCHGGSSGTSCTTTAEARALRKNDCVNCHMPKNGTIDIPHVVTTDHWIRKPVSEAEVGRIREFVRLACINNPEPDAWSRAVAYLNQFEKFNQDDRFLDSARTLLSDQTERQLLENFTSLVRWAYLKEDYGQVIRFHERRRQAGSAAVNKVIASERAWTDYRIAVAFRETARPDSAVRYFQAAVTTLPLQLEFRNELASLLIDLGRYAEARQQLEFILRENPEHVSAWVNLGYLTMVALQDPAAADRCYRTALALDPDHVQALINRAGTRVLDGDAKEARKLLEHALQVQPSNQQARLRLKVLQAMKSR